MIQKYDIKGMITCLRKEVRYSKMEWDRVRVG